MLNKEIEKHKMTYNFEISNIKKELEKEIKKLDDEVGIQKIRIADLESYTM